MSFPSAFEISGRMFELDRSHTRGGVLYIQAHGIRAPYVVVRGARPEDQFESWLATGVYRVRVSHSTGAAEFQRGEIHRLAGNDEFVKNGHADAETLAFGKDVWRALSSGIGRR